MSKREECRKCGAKLKHDKTNEQYDPEYCSGKCRKNDGAEPYVKSVEERAMVVEAIKEVKPASLEDYKKNVPSKYARRFEPEKLNGSENQMNEGELKQAGFRANSEPIRFPTERMACTQDQSERVRYKYSCHEQRTNRGGNPGKRK